MSSNSAYLSCTISRITAFDTGLAAPFAQFVNVIIDGMSKKTGQIIIGHRDAVLEKYRGV